MVSIRVAVVGATVLLGAVACGSAGESVATNDEAVAENAIQSAAAGPEVDRGVNSEAFLSIGDQVRQLRVDQERTKVDRSTTDGFTGPSGRIDPVLTDPIDINAAGEYTVKFAVPAGTEEITLQSLAMVYPGGYDESFYLSNETFTLVADNVGQVVFTVGGFKRPYAGFRVWIY